MSGGRLFHNDNEHRRPKQNNEKLFLTSWHTVHVTEIEIDLSELSTRGKLSIPTS